MTSRYALTALFASSLAVLAVAAHGAPAAMAPLAATEGNQLTPAIAFARGNFLVTWSDQPRGQSKLAAPKGPPPPPPPFPTPPHAAVAVTRLDSSGNVRAPGAIVVSQAANIISRPAIAFGADNALVVWSDYTADPAFAAIYGARVSATGAVLDTTPIQIATSRLSRAYKTRPRVAWDGENYFVVWQDYYPGRGLDVFGARVSPQGTVLDSPAFLVATGGSEPVVAFDGMNYMVAWWGYDFSGRTIFVTRVRHTGQVVDPDGIPIGIELYGVPTPAIGFNGTNYLVAWPGKEAPVGNYDLTAARVSPAGSVLDPNGIQIAAHADEFLEPAVGFDRTNFFVAWKHDRTPCCFINGARISAAGSLLDTTAITISSPSSGNRQEDPTVTSNGPIFVAWTDHRTNESDIYGARIMPSGINLDPRGILLSKPPVVVRCRVPRVIGMRLSRARTTIRKAHCTVGAIRSTRRGRRGRVFAQSPRPGAVKRSGYPIRLVVGRR